MGYIELAKFLIYALVAKGSINHHISIATRALIVSLAPALLEYGLTAYVAFSTGS